jgi:two-component system sensor histidine kinase KdpD
VTARVALTDAADKVADDGEAGARQRAVPLVAPSGERIGTLHVARGEQFPPFDATDEHLLGAVTQQLGTAIERIRLRREATEAETLRRTDELKSALLNAVSHDLRTPLASILASAGSLCQHDIAWTEDEKDDFAGAIVEEAERLKGIVGNLLDLSRIEGGSLRPDKGWHDLGALIGEVVKRVRARYPDHHFAIDVQDDLPPLHIDWVEIDQVLSNLIENAAKYSPVGTKVWISARHDGDCVRVQIADRGPGIPRDALPYLFTPFYRVPPRGGRPRPKGTGLGLAVARGLIEAHGGRIAVRNREDGGAIFTFSLPVTTPPTDDLPEPVASGQRRGR